MGAGEVRSSAKDDEAQSHPKEYTCGIDPPLNHHAFLLPEVPQEILIDIKLSKLHRAQLFMECHANILMSNVTFT